MHTATSTSTATPIWAPCPMCWGQGRIYQDHNGEGIVPSACATCLGLGERLVENAPVRRPAQRPRGSRPECRRAVPSSRPSTNELTIAASGLAGEQVTNVAFDVGDVEA